MNQNKLMQQIGTIFGAFMTIFYVGVGLYFLISSYLPIEKFLRVLVGSTFLVYGVYRGYMTYVKIVEVFFSKDDDDEDENHRHFSRKRFR
jgi:hypothetical protein